MRPQLGISTYVVSREGKVLGRSLSDRDSVRYRRHTLIRCLAFPCIAIRFCAQLGFPGCGSGKLDLAQVRQAGGGVWSRKDLLPSLRRLGVWLQRGSVCLGGHCREAGGPTGAELTGLALGESLAHCCVSREPLRSFH